MSAREETKRRRWWSVPLASVSIVARLVALVALGWLAARWLPVWRVRRWAAVWSVRLPDRLLPTHLRVLPPPDREYFGVWEVPPAEARRRLESTYGFRQQIRAYLHAYQRNGSMRYEEASYSYRPDGLLGPWQLHVRLFPTADGATALWCHWERNPTVAPLAHLRQDGYDPAEGKQRLRALLNEPLRLGETE